MYENHPRTAWMSADYDVIIACVKTEWWRSSNDIARQQGFWTKGPKSTSWQSIGSVQLLIVYTSVDVTCVWQWGPIGYSVPFDTGVYLGHKASQDIGCIIQCVRKVAVRLGYGRVQLKCDGTRWHTGGEVRKVALQKGVGSDVHERLYRSEPV